MAERERPQGGSPRVREDPLGTPPSLSAKKVSENLEKVPRIWEGEGSRRSEIMNASNNDYWVAKTFRLFAVIAGPFVAGGSELIREIRAVFARGGRHFNPQHGQQCEKLL